MPIYQLVCPDCHHRFKGMVFAGTQHPKEWVCSQCGSLRAHIDVDAVPIPHPLEAVHGSGCSCCGSPDQS